MGNLTVGAEFAGYRIDGIAGRGGMGVVYRATDLRLDRPVALKVISPELAEDPEFRRRFEVEARLAASLDHPNVIPIHHADIADGVLYVTMRFVEGTDLRAMIASDGALEPRLAAKITAQVGAALDDAHAHGLVHRDVKPANVLIAGRGEQLHAYLTDFGLTKVASSESGMTSTGMIVGTIDYMAPEQVQDGARVDARTDIYALGGMLYHALTGEVPFPRASDAAKIFAHGTDPVPDPRTVRPELAAVWSEVVGRAMAKAPEDRYLSAGDLGRAALAAAEGQALSRAEHNIAIGDAAPLQASPVPPRQAAVGTGDETQPSPGGRGPADPTVPAAAPAPDAEAAPRAARIARRRLPPRAAVGLSLMLAAAVLVGALAALGVFSGGESSSEQASEEQVLDTARLTVEPSGRRAMFSVFEGSGGEVVVIVSAEDDGGGFSEVARIVAPGARANPADVQSGAIQLEASQEGRHQEGPDGGQGLLSIGDEYARYFGWSLKDQRIEFY